MQSNTSVTHVNSTEAILTVEICGKLFCPNLVRRNAAAGALRGAQALRGTQGVTACSACAGDYEDPDRTAWANDERENDERETENEDGTQAGGEEFLAES